MRISKVIFTAAMSSLFLLVATSAKANTPGLVNLGNYAGVTIQTSCDTCHAGIPNLNTFGAAYKSAGGSKANAYVLSNASWLTLSAADSDSDGTNNMDELVAGSNPGVSGTTVVSTADASVGGCMTTTSWLSTFLLGGLLALALVFKRRQA